MNTGEPRHLTVTDWPSGMAEMSTSVDDRARTDASGFIWLTIGQATAATPTALTAAPAT
jgi:hypothetical protein